VATAAEDRLNIRAQIRTLLLRKARCRPVACRAAYKEKPR